MPELKYDEKIAKENIIQKSYTYLNDNFHKFNDVNKIKIALQIITRDLQKPLVDSSTHHHQTTIVQQIRAVLNAEPARANRLESALQE
jgi:hypothetical protein